MSDVYPDDENLLQDSQEPLNLETPPQQPRKKLRGMVATVANQAIQVKKAAENLAEKEVEIFHLRGSVSKLKKHLRECIGMEEIGKHHLSLLYLRKCFKKKYPSFPSIFYFYPFFPPP